MPNGNQIPNLLIKKNQFHYLHMYIHKHPCESKQKFTNMKSFSSILQGYIQRKKNQVEFISSLKYINKYDKSLVSIQNIEVGRLRTLINTL